MSEVMIIVCVSALTLALCSGLVGFALTTRRFGEAYFWTLGAFASFASIIGAVPS